MPTASALLRSAAVTTTLLASSCLNWSRFHGPDGSDASDDTVTLDVLDAADADAFVDDIATSDGDADAADAHDDITTPDADVTMADIATDRMCTTPGAPDYCSTISPLPSAPVIDGVLECGVALQRFTAADYYPVNGPPPAGLVASFAAAWRPDGLYVYGQVEGSNDDPPAPGEGAYCGDDFEIYLDSDAMYAALPAYDTTGTRQILLPAPPRGATTGGVAQVYRDRVLQPEPVTRWVSRRVGSVVYFEALITAAELALSSWSLAASQRIGLDVGITLGNGLVSDAGPCRHLLGHFYFRLAPGDGGCIQPSCTPLAFCSPTLGP